MNLYVLIGIVAIVMTLVIVGLIWLGCNLGAPYKYNEARIVIISRLNNRRYEKEWRPIAYLKLLKEEVDTMRENDDGSCSFSIEYQ